MSHQDISYAYTQDPAPQSSGGWAGGESSGRVVISGTCARCGGPAWGPQNSEPSLGGVTPQSITAGSVVPTDSEPVLVECRCGQAHGTHADSCGWHATLQYVDGALTIVPVNAADDDAARIVQEHRVKRLAETQSRAQHWLAGNAAILALLGSALVFSAPDDISKLKTWASILVLIAAIGGLLLLAVSVYLSYAAAYGDSQGTAVDRLVDATFDPGGLSGRLEESVRTDVAASRTQLRLASRFALVGVVVVALAAALAGVFPQESSDADSSSPSKGICVKVGSAIVKVPSGPDVVKAGTVEFADCPTK